MQDSYVLKAIAKLAQLPISLERWLVSLRNGELIPSLSENYQLSDETWMDLMTNHKLDVYSKQKLIQRGLPEGGLSVVLHKEKRKSVLETLLGYELTFEQSVELSAAPAASSTVLFCLAQQFARHRMDGLEVAANIQDLWSRMGAAEALRFASQEIADPYGSAISDEEILDLLLNLTERWDSKKWGQRSEHIKVIIHHRPSFIPQLVEHKDLDESIATAIAGSMYLEDEGLQATLCGLDPETFKSLNNGRSLRFTKFMQLALVNNPRCTTNIRDAVRECTVNGEVRTAIGMRQRQAERREAVTGPYSEVTDPKVLRWLIDRSTPRTFGHKTTACRIFDLAELALNPNFTDSDWYVIEEIVKTVGTPFMSVDQLGVVAWAKVHDTMYELNSDAYPLTQEARCWIETEGDGYTQIEDVVAEFKRVASGDTTELRGSIRPTWLKRIEQTLADRAGFNNDGFQQTESYDEWLTDGSFDPEWPVNLYEVPIQNLRQWPTLPTIWMLVHELLDVCGEDTVQWESALNVFEQYGSDSERTVGDALRVIKRLKAAA